MPIPLTPEEYWPGYIGRSSDWLPFQNLPKGQYPSVA